MGTWSPVTCIPTGHCVIEGSVAFPGCEAVMLPENPSLPCSILVMANWDKGNLSPAMLQAPPSPVGGGPWVRGVEQTRQPTRDRVRL